MGRWKRERTESFVQTHEDVRRGFSGPARSGGAEVRAVRARASVQCKAQCIVHTVHLQSGVCNMQIQCNEYLPCTVHSHTIRQGPADYRGTRECRRCVLVPRCLPLPPTYLRAIP